MFLSQKMGNINILIVEDEQRLADILKMHLEEYGFKVETAYDGYIGKQMAEIDEVQEVHWPAGEYNYLVKARVSSTETLAQLMKKFGEIPGVRDSRTTLVLDTLKETQALSLRFIECKQPKKSAK